MDRDPLPVEPVETSADVPVAMFAKMAIAAVAIAAVVVFAMQNLDSVPVDFLSFSFDMPLVLLLAIAACVGVLLRWLVALWWSRRDR